MQRESTDANEDFIATLLVDPMKEIDTKAEFVTLNDAKAIYQACAPRLVPPALPNLEAYDLSFADAVLDPTGKFTPGTFQIDRAAFPGDQKYFRLHHSQNLALAVTDGTGDHPLHIHVNPFLVSADPSRAASGLPTCAFWADTLLLQHGQPAVNVTMPFNHWSGESVSHCHILDHEDAGMMNLIRIRPDVFSWPEFPLAKILEMPVLPPIVLNSLKTTWPKRGSPVAASVPKSVSLFFFLPATAAGEPCPHCTEAVKAVADVRRVLGSKANVRVVVVSAAARDALPSFDSLGLVEETDVLCADDELRAFEAIGLIDGTPVLSKDETKPWRENLTFPGAFKPKTHTPKWPSDIMHGLFIVDPDGMVVSARRAFRAFDDTDQIIHEVELAGQGHDAILAAYKRASASGNTPADTSRGQQQQSRYEQRLKVFETTAK